MPRIRRATLGGHCYHALNRGNRRETVFHDRDDYRRFLDLAARAQARLPLRVLAWCLMPNHFHLVAWPARDGDLSRWMHWLLTAHVRHHHLRHGSSGRVWQGRFKAFPIQQDLHLLRVMRYVERNPLRAGLVTRAEAWPWSSLSAFIEGRDDLLAGEGPTPRIVDWVRYVNLPQTHAEVEQVRSSARSDLPLGEDNWVSTEISRTMSPRLRSRFSRN